VVGEIAIKLKPSLGILNSITKYDSGETNLNNYLGHKLDLLINIQHASELPRVLCASVFARTMFFLRHEAFTTPRCVATTVNPCFDSTFRVSQIITEDFLIYLNTDALELQVWGQAICPWT